MNTLQHIPTVTYARTLRNPTFLNRTTGERMPNDTGWQDRHVDALRAPRGFERPIVDGIEAWARYADTHRTRYESSIGEDNVLGGAWLDWGRALRMLLNGETGRLDCGTLDAFILDTLAAEGHADV